ncbi:MAG: helix-turn-helix transcriptional regulator [Lentisphaeria bacterium]|nr:helix-turn-helix transcriptional regulator [Lentisphaeria bacterium]
MDNDVSDFLKRYVRQLREPEDLFSGKRLPESFALPDNILVFFHSFTSPAPNSHGRCTVVLPFDRMTYFVDRQRYFLSPGTVLFVPPYAVRFLHPESDGYRRLFITFDDPGRQPYLPAAGQAEIDVPGWERLEQLLTAYDNGTAEDLSFLLMDFLRGLHTAFHDRKESDHTLPEPLERSIAFIEMNMSHVIGIKDIAEHVGLSESHLRSLFRTEMNISLGKFIARKRLDAAQYRLLHSDESLTEIAAACGFSNIFVFSAFFKRHTGIPPLRYRQKANSLT